MYRGLVAAALIAITAVGCSGEGTGTAEPADTSSPTPTGTETKSSSPTPTPTPSATPTVQLVDGPIQADAHHLKWDEIASDEPMNLPGILEDHRGQGDGIVDLERPQADPVVAFRHQGDANFIVRAIFDDGSDSGLVNEIGDYIGEVLAETPQGARVESLEIQADGPWIVLVNNLLFARDSDDLGRSYEGTGDSVILFPIDNDDPQPIVRFNRATLNHDGEANFIVGALLGRGLVNEIGPYQGTVRLPSDGLFGLQIEADGAWTVSLE